MKPAIDLTIDYKALVQRGYDRCAADYSRARLQESERALSVLSPRLIDGAGVLDIGCGGGIPVARELARRFDVTGVDISGAMIELARANVPDGTFIHSDIMAVDFPPSSFDAAVALYAIFHLPREEHAELFQRVHQWLKPGGYLLATLSRWNEPAYTEDDFFGVTMHWSNFGLGEYQELLDSIGFELLDATVLGHGYAGNATSDEHHPLILARKRGREERGAI